jgi:hypothetical protein
LSSPLPVSHCERQCPGHSGPGSPWKPRPLALPGWQAGPAWPQWPVRVPPRHWPVNHKLQVPSRRGLPRRQTATSTADDSESLIPGLRLGTLGGRWPGKMGPPGDTPASAGPMDLPSVLLDNSHRSAIVHKAPSGLGGVATDSGSELTCSTSPQSSTVSGPAATSSRCSSVAWIAGVAVSGFCRKAIQLSEAMRQTVPVTMSSSVESVSKPEVP